MNGRFFNNETGSLEVGFSSTTAGNVAWTDVSVVGFFEEAETIEVEDTLGAGSPGVVGVEAALEAAAVAAQASTGLILLRSTTLFSPFLGWV